MTGTTSITAIAADAPPATSAPGLLTAEPAWLDQTRASAFLLTLGVTIAPKTLQKRRVIGGGPPFRKMMGRVVYERVSLRAWAEAQRSPPVTSTSELAPRGN